MEWTPEEIRSHRHRRGLTQEELANRIGVSRSIINKWELGERQPGGRNIRKLQRELVGDTLSDIPLSQATYTQLLAELHQRHADRDAEFARLLADRAHDTPAPDQPKSRDLGWPRSSEPHTGDTGNPGDNGA